MKLNQAISQRLSELLADRSITAYRLYTLSGVHKATIGNVLHCSYDSVNLRILHEICQGLGISLREFFSSPLFDEENLDP